VVEPVRGSASWTRDGTPDDALSALVAYARTHGGRAKVNGSEVTLRFGSRLAYRLMGVATWRVPYAVRVFLAASRSGPVKLTAEAYSDAGWYAFRVESATLTYERRIAETLDELQRQ
jgi:hypothetical protein